MRFLHFIYITTVSLCLVSYVFYQSLIAYFVQQYHYVNNDIKILDSILDTGAVIATTLEKYRIMIFEKDIIYKDTHQYSFFDILDNTVIHVNNGDSATIATAKQDSTNNISNNHQDFQVFQDNDDAITLHFSNTSHDVNSHKSDTVSINSIDLSKEKGVKIINNRLFVAPNTHFLLIGDSLMQGIGMTLARELSKQGFKVRNIAKQSTGLTYPSFFNWEKATKQALVSNPKIAVIVVCLGANDPWDMAGMRFGTDIWLTTYKKRIARLFELAEEYKAIIVWYEIPSIKRKTLNDKVITLNDLYKESIDEYGGIFIPADAILVDRNFTAYIKNADGKSMLVRTPDGIHFTRYGSTLLTQSLLDRLETYTPESLESHNDIPHTPTTQQTISSSQYDDKDTMPHTMPLQDSQKSHIIHNEILQDNQAALPYHNHTTRDKDMYQESNVINDIPSTYQEESDKTLDIWHTHPFFNTKTQDENVNHSTPLSDSIHKNTYNDNDM